MEILQLSTNQKLELFCQIKFIIGNAEQGVNSLYFELTTKYKESAQIAFSRLLEADGIGFLVRNSL